MNNIQVKKFFRSSFLVVVGVSLVIFSPMGSAGFPGNVIDAGRNFVGQAWKAGTNLIPGSGGPSDQLLGGVLGYPGQQIFGSAIKDLDGALGRNVDKLDVVVGKNIEKFNADMQGLLTQGDQIMGKNIAAFDQTLQNNVQSLGFVIDGSVQGLDTALQASISSLDESFQKTVGGLDVVLSVKAAAAWEAMAKRIVAYGCIVVFFTICVWHIYETVVVMKKGWKDLAYRRIGFGLAALAAIVVGAYAIPSPNDKAIEKLTSRYLSEYNQALAVSDFRRAAYDAYILQVLDGGEAKSQGMAQKAGVLRDVLLRPATYSSPESRLELSNRINIAYANLAERGPADPDLITLTAFVRAQTDPSINGLMVAANLCAMAVKSSQGQKDRTFALAPLAAHYIQSYLRAPVPNSDFEILFGESQEKVNERIAADGNLDKGILKFQYLPVEVLKGQLEAISTPAASGKFSVFDVPGAQPLARIVDPEQFSQTLYYQVLPLYVKMIEAASDAASQGRTPEDQKRLIQDRNNNALSIVQTFDAATANIADYGGESTVIRLRLLRGLHAVYSRARAYVALGVGGVGNIPAQDLGNSSNTIIHLRWLDAQTLGGLGLVQPSSTTNSAYYLIKNLGAISFKVQEQALMDFEKKMKDFHQIPTGDIAKPQRALDLANASSVIGLLNSGANVEIVEPYAVQLTKRYATNAKSKDVSGVYKKSYTVPGGALL